MEGDLHVSESYGGDDLNLWSPLDLDRHHYLGFLGLCFVRHLYRLADRFAGLRDPDLDPQSLDHALDHAHAGCTRLLPSDVAAKASMDGMLRLKLDPQRRLLLLLRQPERDECYQKLCQLS